MVTSKTELNKIVVAQFQTFQLRQPVYMEDAIISYLVTSKKYESKIQINDKNKYL